MQDNTNLFLHQQGKTSEQRHFELKAGRELHITHSKSHKTRKYAFSILALLEQGKRIYQFKKRWLILGLCTMTVILLFPQIQHHLPFDPEPYAIYILAGLFFMALMFFMLLVNTFRRHYVLLSSHTRLPLAEFWVNNPSRKDFQNFISELEKRIKQHKAEMNIPYDKQLAGELRTLRRVTEAGFLSESVYQAARAKLLLMSDINYQPPTKEE